MLFFYFFFFLIQFSELILTVLKLVQKFNSTYITYFLLYDMSTLSTHALARGHYRCLLDSLSREPVIHQISLYLTMKVYLCHKSNES